MPSCASRQDVIKAFSRLKVGYGGYSRHAVLRRGSNSSMLPSRRIYRACYIAVPLYVCGFLVLGEALKKHDSVGALVMGWGIAMVALMVNTVAVCTSLQVRATREDSSFFVLDAYANDCFPKHQGEISALLNLGRTLGGFSVAYFQVPWATKRGPLEAFGCEAA
jgi:hypothetical protein